MPVAGPAEAPSRLARIGRALKPNFRPKRRDFLLAAGVFVVALPFVIAFSWTGKLLDALGVYALTFLAVAPVSLILLLVVWRADTRKYGSLQRAALQAFMGAFTIVPMVVVANVTERVSIDTSMRRGDQIVAELRAYRENHWRYPRSLEALERSIGRSLPRPSIADEFFYHSGWRSFRLSFIYPIFGCKEYDSKKGYWRERALLEGGLLK
jgi:hypothetical protein